jgi:hypothetical protein
LTGEQKASHPAAPEPDPEALRAQLANAVALSIKQDQIAWTVFGVFWAASAVLLVALFTTGDVPKRPVGVIVCTVGTALSLVWYVVQVRAIGYLNFYDSVVETIEIRLGLPAEIALSGRINNTHRSVHVKGVSVRPVMVACTIVSAALWVCGFVWFCL